jgi:hypothetical protein
MSRLRGKLFFDEEALRERTKLCGVPFDFLQYGLPWVRGMASLGAEGAPGLIGQVAGNDSERAVFQTSNPATPLEQPGQTPPPQQVPLSKYDQFLYT